MWGENLRSSQPKTLSGIHSPFNQPQVSSQANRGGRSCPSWWPCTAGEQLSLLREKGGGWFKASDSISEIQSGWAPENRAWEGTGGVSSSDPGGNASPKETRAEIWGAPDTPNQKQGVGDFPGDPVLRIGLIIQGARVRFLVRKLRSHVSGNHYA